MTTGRITKILPKTPKISPMVEENLKNNSQRSRKKSGGILRNLPSSHTAQFPLQSASTNNRYGSGSIPTSQQNLSDAEILNGPLIPFNATHREVNGSNLEDLYNFLDEFNSLDHNTSLQNTEPVCLAHISDDEILNASPIVFNSSHGDINRLHLEDSYKFLDELGNSTPDLSIPETQYMEVDNTENMNLTNEQDYEMGAVDNHQPHDDMLSSIPLEQEPLTQSKEEAQIIEVGKFYEENKGNYSTKKMLEQLGLKKNKLHRMLAQYRAITNPIIDHDYRDILLGPLNRDKYFFARGKNIGTPYSEDAKKCIKNYYLKMEVRHPVNKIDIYANIEAHTKISLSTIENILKKNKNIKSYLDNIEEKLKEEFAKINKGDEKEKKINLVGEFYRKYSKNCGSKRIAKLLGENHRYILNLCYMYEHSKDPTPNKWNVNSLLKHANINADFFKKDKRKVYSEEAKNSVIKYLKSTEDPEIKNYNLYAFIELYTKIPYKTIKTWHYQK